MTTYGTSETVGHRQSACGRGTTKEGAVQAVRLHYTLLLATPEYCFRSNEAHNIIWVLSKVHSTNVRVPLEHQCDLSFIRSLPVVDFACHRLDNQEEGSIIYFHNPNKSNNVSRWLLWSATLVATLRSDHQPYFFLYKVYDS